MNLIEPKQLARQHLPIVLSSPHSGTEYEADLLAQLALPREDLHPLEDGPVDTLLFPLSALGIPLLFAPLPRAYVDLNRAPDEIDRTLVPDWVPLDDRPVSIRARAGLGLVPTHIGTKPLYRAPIKAAEVRKRCERGHRPYHQALSQALERTHKRFGSVLLIDCHSMPEIATSEDGRLVDFALGDRYGESCDPRIVQCAERLLKHQSYTVMRNHPFAGGYITSHYGKPHQGFHALQLEIRRSLFMNEKTRKLSTDFKKLQTHLTRMVNSVAEELCAFA